MTAPAACTPRWTNSLGAGVCISRSRRVYDTSFFRAHLDDALKVTCSLSPVGSTVPTVQRVSKKRVELFEPNPDICYFHIWETRSDAAARKGSAEILILAALEDGQLHGYDIAREIARRSDGLLTFHVASLYPLLYKLEERGWILGRWVERAANGGAGLSPHRRGPPRAGDASATGGRRSCSR